MRYYKFPMNLIWMLASWAAIVGVGIFMVVDGCKWRRKEAE